MDVQIGNYKVEFPVAVNGNESRRTGFITPLPLATHQRSQFFIHYDGGRIAYDFPEQVPQYVKREIERTLR
jgi:hypothetical protein